MDYYNLYPLFLITAAPVNTKNSAERASTNILLGLMQEVQITCMITLSTANEKAENGCGLK